MNIGLLFISAGCVQAPIYWQIGHINLIAANMSMLYSKLLLQLHTSGPNICYCRFNIVIVSMLAC